MIQDLPLYVYLVFFGALFLAIYMFYLATYKNKIIIGAVIIIGIFHSVLAVYGFYENTDTVPPRLLMVLIPNIIIILVAVFSTKMQAWMQSLSFKHLTFLHSVRVPVELVIYWIFVAGYMPRLMTFEDGNLDILIGIAAPVVGFFSFRGKQMNKKALWILNIASIIFLVNIVVRAVLSAPGILQTLAYDQPNTGILYFPFVLLPGIIVPLVLLSNIAGFFLLKKARTVEATQAKVAV